MRLFFHLDREGSLRIGETISLRPIKMSTELTGPIEHVNELFKTGVSRHGLQYINQATTSESYIEWFFEYVRRGSFINHPSRFQSFFSVSSLEDIKRLKHKLKISDGTITSNSLIINLKSFLIVANNMIASAPPIIPPYIASPPLRICQNVVNV